MKLGFLIETNVPPAVEGVPANEYIAHSVEQFLREGAAAEAAGFDSLHVPERHMRPECHFPTPLQLLTALAARTNRIRLNTHTLILTLYHPMQVAEQSAMIDMLSRGRHTLTVAMGYLPLYWRMIGATGDGRRERFIESVEILRLAFAGKPFSFHGRHFTLEDVILTPPPYQGERFPLWLAGHFEKTMQRAAVYGDGWAGNPFPQELQSWNARVNAYREAAAKNGRKALVCCARDAWVGATHAEAMRTFRTHEEHYIREMRFYFRKGILRHPDFGSEADITLERLLPHMVIGSASECAERLQQHAEQYQLDHCVLRLRMPRGPGFQETLDAIALCGEAIIPAVQGREAAPAV